MDFVTLAVREARRNASRTLLAVVAVALAAAAPILARMLPQGYVKEYRISERQYVGGDIVVWTAPAPIDTRDNTPLSWRPWDGSDWQSDALYFLPSLETAGYLAEKTAPPWRPITAGSVKPLLKGTPGISEIRPYLTLPCRVQTLDGPVPAILRGRDPDPKDSALSLASFVDVGRPLSDKDRGTEAALVPLAGGNAPGAFFVGLDITVTAGPATVTLSPVGGYRVAVGEAEDRTQPPDRDGHFSVVKVYWERPEIIVTEETFRAIASKVSGSAIDSLDGYPVYQLSLTATKISSLQSTVAAVRAALGPGYAVYSVPELVEMKNSSTVTPVTTRDLWPVFLALSFSLSSVIVTGSVYILLSQQRRKIGLLRVVGATRRDVVVYSLSVALYVTLVGDAAGFLGGKVLSLLALLAGDMTALDWLRMTVSDLLTVLGLSLGITGALGFAVGLWASRIPCAEVLRRE